MRRLCAPWTPCSSTTRSSTPGVHQHTLKVSVIGPGPRAYSFERAKALLGQRLHRLPPFRWRIVRVPGDLHHPFVVEDPDFDLDFLVRRLALPAPRPDCVSFVSRLRHRRPAARPDEAAVGDVPRRGPARRSPRLGRKGPSHAGRRRRQRRASTSSVTPRPKGPIPGSTTGSRGWCRQPLAPSSAPCRTSLGC